MKRPSNITVKIVVAAVGVFVLLNGCYFGLLYYRGMSYEVQGASYEAVQKYRPVKAFVPPEAKRITAWVAPQRMAITASFDIDEDAFVAWARKMEWAIKAVRDAEVKHISDDGDPNGRTVIRDGWLYRKRWGAVDERVYAFDRSTGRGYVTQLVD